MMEQQNNTLETVLKIARILFIIALIISFTSIYWYKYNNPHYFLIQLNQTTNVGLNLNTETDSRFSTFITEPKLNCSVMQEFGKAYIKYKGNYCLPEHLPSEYKDTYVHYDQAWQAKLYRFIESYWYIILIAWVGVFYSRIKEKVLQWKNKQ